MINNENRILNMSEGKNLDVLVLRTVMTDNWVKSMYSDIEYEKSPNYSKDFFRIEEIIAKLMSNMLDVKIECTSMGTVNKLYDCTISKDGIYYSSAVMQPSIQVAVCKGSIIAMNKLKDLRKIEYNKYSLKQDLIL
jgi:hypothetical protein